LEQTSLALFIEIIGESLPIFGVWAGVTYLLAETGLAIGIVIAIIAGETAVLAFQDPPCRSKVSRAGRQTPLPR
jgi:hypothetical protein